jgi:hypothetical protein
MPATPARIGFITQEYRVATAGPNTAVRALYGNKARTADQPIETFFDTVADAQAMANERLALLEVQRSILTVAIDQIDPATALDPSLLLPTVRVIDTEQDRNLQALVVGFSIDMNTDRSVFETWG